MKKRDKLRHDPAGETSQLKFCGFLSVLVFVCLHLVALTLSSPEGPAPRERRSGLGRVASIKPVRLSTGILARHEGDLVAREAVRGTAERPRRDS
jgi:hypothetical protein